MNLDERIRKTGLACILGIFAVCFTGCIQKETVTPVEITLMHGWGGTLKTHKAMQDIYNDFSKKNPDIILKCIPYSDSSIAVEKANDMLAVGKVPDILSTNGLSYYVKNASKCDMIMDLMPYIEEDSTWKAQIHPTVFDTWKTSSQRLYTIPDALEVAGYWYNKAYLKAAGIVDKTGAVSLPKTWDEFITMTERLQLWIDSTEQNQFVFAMDDAQMTEFLFLARLAGEDESGLLSAENPYVKIQKNTLTNTLRDLDIVRNHSKQVNNIDNARQSFMDGKSIIYFNGVWESDVLRDSSHQQDFAYANYPTKEGKTLTYISPSSGYVLAKQTDSRKIDACIRFLKYMVSDEVQIEIALKTGQAPSNPNIDLARINLKDPLLGMAINNAYQADIHIKTIRSVWAEEKVDVVLRYIGLSSWNIENMDGILKELNAKQP